MMHQYLSPFVGQMQRKHSSKEILHSIALNQNDCRVATLYSAAAGVRGMFEFIQLVNFDAVVWSSRIYICSMYICMAKQFVYVRAYHHTL